MRGFFNALFLLCSCLFFSNVSFSQGQETQKGKGDITAFTAFTFNKGSEASYLDLSFYIVDNGDKNDLGISSFVMQYDSSSLIYQLESVSTALLTKGYFTTGLESYMDPYSMHYGTKCHSVEIDCNDATATIPDTATLIGTIRFKIMNLNGLAGFKWKKNYCAVYDGKSKLLNVDYIEPEKISLSGADLDFHSTMSNGRVLLLDRLTQSEIAERGVTIERSKDGIHFEAFEPNVVEGNSTQQMEYSAFDPHPFPNTSFYRLVSTKGGKHVLLGMITVHRN